MKRPFLSITLGDPAGCGPWVAARAALDNLLRRRCRPVLVGDAWVVHQFVRLSGMAVNPLLELDDYTDRPGTVNVLHVPHPDIHGLEIGRSQRVGGESAIGIVFPAMFAIGTFLVSKFYRDVHLDAAAVLYGNI